MMDTVTTTQRHLPSQLRGLPCIRTEVAHVIAPGKATPSLEGPVFDRHGNFYCCLTAPNDTYVKKISPDGSISDFFHSDSGMTVGLVFHQDGRCFAADMLRNCIRILSADGKLLEELPLQYEGRKLRPDCMVFDRKGDLLFTDLSGTFRDPIGGVYRLTQDSGYGSFASITQAGWFLLVIVVLCIVKIDGKPLMNANKHFKEGSMWGMITAVGIFSMLGGALASNDLGINQWLTEVLGPMFSDMSWPVFVLLIVVVCTVVTNFFSNMATGVIVSSLTAPFAAQYADAGINITVIGTAIAFSSMFAYLTYAAAGPAPLLLGKEGIESKFVWSKGVLALVIYAVAATVVFSLIGYIL